MVFLQNERLGVDLGAVVTPRSSVVRFAKLVRDIEQPLRENFMNACSGVRWITRRASRRDQAAAHVLNGVHDRLIRGREESCALNLI
jgi:hypothetical protein